MIHLTTAPIDPAAAIAAARSPAAGAIVLFLGTVREMTDGRRTVALEYECYAEMAEKKLAELEAEARARWPIAGCAIIHRWGRLEIGAISVAIAVAAPHRRKAFAAGQWLIDRIKEVVPVWKKEFYADGTAEWQHPHVES